jgi:ATP-dependent Clp protease ATP-binding subunit ClpC
MADTNLPVQYGGPSKTPTLDAFGRDLTALARDNKLDQVEGRDEQIERVIQILGRRTKNNPCLIGEPGVGKTAIAEGLAQRIISGEVPSVLRNKRVITLDLAGLVAGTKYRGEFEERMKRVVDELRIAAHQIILFIDEVHTLVGAGAAEGAMDASNIIKPAMARGEMQCMGATTLREYRKYIERDSALERRFQPVLVPEPSIEQTVAILRRNIDRYEDRHCVQYDEEALKAAAELSHRYISDRFLPDKAIDLSTRPVPECAWIQPHTQRRSRASKRTWQSWKIKRYAGPKECCAKTSARGISSQFATPCAWSRKTPEE